MWGQKGRKPKTEKYLESQTLSFGSYMSVSSSIAIRRLQSRNRRRESNVLVGISCFVFIIFPSSRNIFVSIESMMKKSVGERAAVVVVSDTDRLYRMNGHGWRCERKTWECEREQLRWRILLLISFVAIVPIAIEYRQEKGSASSETDIAWRNTNWIPNWVDGLVNQQRKSVEWNLKINPIINRGAITVVHWSEKKTKVIICTSIYSFLYQIYPLIHLHIYVCAVSLLLCSAASPYPSSFASVTTYYTLFI